jgi:hypothetical protein
MKKILVITICMVFLNLQIVSAVQYAPTNHPEIPEMDIATGVSSHILDNLEGETLEEYIPEESQKQIDKLENWGIEWSKFINYIILIGVLLLILAIYLERHNIKKVFKKKT